MIPWPGDIVTVNPDAAAIGSRHSTKIEHAGQKLKVTDTIPIQAAPNCVLVMWQTLDGRLYSGVRIRQPDGRHSEDPEGSPPLFLLESGDEQREFVQGMFVPIPNLGNMIGITDGQGMPVVCTIGACPCNGIDHEHWPYGRMGCGAHVRTDDGRDWGICYTLDSTRAFQGWVYDGVLTRPRTSVQRTWDAATLKTANTRPDAVRCAKCGGDLKDPGYGPTYRHCPKCEP